MDDLFDFENVDTEKILKEAKGKSYARIILISLTAFRKNSSSSIL